MTKASAAACVVRSESEHSHRLVTDACSGKLS